MGKYIDTDVGKVYLKKIYSSFGYAVDNLDLTADEIDYAEVFADNEVDSILGTEFDPFPASPLIVRDICLLLTAAKCREMLLVANAPNTDEHTDKLEKKALKMLNDILTGKRSIIMPDKSFHPMYPGPSGGMKFAPQHEEQLRGFFINMDEEFFSMHYRKEERGIEPEFHDRVYNDPSRGYSSHTDLP